jgi:hypothetical protein
MAYKFLLEIHEELFTRSINIFMTLEMAGVNKIFEPEDPFNLEIKQLRGAPDTNLN